MATATNLTREAEFAQKKTVSVMAINIDDTTREHFNAAGSFLVGYLPENALVVDALAWVKTATAANTLLVGTTVGGKDILDAADTSSTGKAGTAAQIDTGTGKPVYVNTTAAMATGNLVVIIKYIEYTKNNGEYTRID